MSCCAIRRHKRMIVKEMYLVWRRLQRVKLYRYSILSIVFIYIVYKVFWSSPGTIRLPSNVDPTKFSPFEPDVTSDLPTGDGTDSKIPKIIHQTWISETIPAKFADNIKSFTKNNPSWEYYLWTDSALTALVEKHLPQLLPVWNNYMYSHHHRLRRFNAARYLIMYLYGGVFADIDILNYRPLVTAIQKYDCILPPEPYEHIFSTHLSFTLTNSIMLCRPKHPFFKLVMDNLHRYVHLSHSWDSAGPGYLTSQYRLYISSHNKTKESHGDEKQQYLLDSRPYMVREHFTLSDTDAIYVPNSHYFTGTSDTEMHSTLQRSCGAGGDLHLSLQRVCVDLSRRGLVRGRSKFTYTEHLWQNNFYKLSNFYLYTWTYLYVFGTDIHDIVPNCKIPFVTEV